MPEAERSTEEIVRDLKQGRDRHDNFRLLYERYGRSLRRFFERKGIPEADELKDDVLLAVYRNLETLREDASFEAWLFQIARNRYKNWLAQRKGAGRIALSLDSDEAKIDPPAPATMSPEAKAIDRERLQRVWAALEELPPQKRLVAILAWVEDRSPKEIAAMLPITINTVYAHLHQAQKTLRDKLGFDVP